MPQDDALVVGAGPSGLFAACELARHGIKVRLVEREVRRHRQARATAIQPGTLEILDSVGLLSPFLETAEHVQCTRLYSADLSELRVRSRWLVAARAASGRTMAQFPRPGRSGRDGIR
jgi:2-polyprenyl-6-methoxyphenol hydroxylase-like FAD-dependent oxidoreductase